MCYWVHCCRSSARYQKMCHMFFLLYSISAWSDTRHAGWGKAADDASGDKSAFNMMTGAKSGGDGFGGYFRLPSLLASW